MAATPPQTAASATAGWTGRVPFFRSLRGRLIITLALFAGLSALVISVNDFRYVRDMLRESVTQQLTLRAEGLSQVLLAYIEQQRERVLLVASRTRLRSLMRERLDEEIDDARFLAQSSRILNDARNSIDSFREIRIADLNGRVITATSQDLVGQDVADEPTFQPGLEQPTLGLPTRTPTGFIAQLSAPARTNDGRALGVVLVEIDADPMRAILRAIPSKFTSAQVRVAAPTDGQIRYLFPATDNPSNAIADSSADTAMAAALGGGTGFSAVADYAGRAVLAAHQPVGYGGWGLVTQVDTDEADAPIFELRTVIVIAAGVVALLGIALGIQVGTAFTRPVLELAEVASRVGAGHLNARASVGARDETGVMARAFNAMADSLQKHQTQLEDLVAERTLVLEERTEQLQRSHRQLEELCRMLEDQAEITERDLHRAEIIQRSLLPHEPPQLSDFCVQTLYRPGRNVGGDLYDVIKLGDRHLVLVIADASGHGVSAAMLAVLFKHRLRVVNETTGQPITPDVAMAQLNESLIRDIRAPGVFFTCAYCLVDTASRELHMASAGHPPVLVIGQDGNVEQLEHTGPALGLYDEASYELTKVDLKHQDRVLLYTDGLFDVDGGGPPDVSTIAEALRTLSPHRRVLEKVLVAVSGGRERADRDDVTMLLLDAESGPSYFYDAKEEVELRVERDQREPEIMLAEDDTRTFISVGGRVTWTYGEAMLAAADSAIGANRALIFDLRRCDYLDSTMLGTLHEVVQRAEANGSSVQLQGVSPVLRQAFAELSMDTVLGRMTKSLDPLPTERRRLEIREADLSRQRERLLKAHEALAELSDENKDQFGGVIEALRAERDPNE